MPEYIDVSKTVEAFEEQHGRESTLLNCYNADWIVSFIESQPTADVQEVRHGRWMEDKETGYLICSECGRFTDEIIGHMIVHDGIIIQRSMHPFYCSKCGAKMDGEE